jgi:ABC-type transport system involved in multi-copper enzyme maturation permease subunit
MIRVVHSELARLARPRLIGAWYGLVAVFSLFITQVMFSSASEGGAPTAGPGAAFPTLAELQTADGSLIALSAGASLFGIITLAFWAVATATDYTTGLVRLLVSAEPRRWRLLLGKVVALAVVTAGAAAVATTSVALASPVFASLSDVGTAAWTLDVGSVVAAWVNSFAAMVVWGSLGLVVAVLTRSSGIAIAVGVGYVLVVETIVQQALGEGTSWLLGNVLGALAAGGTASLGYGSAALFGVVYGLVGLALATVVVTTRDVND